jgi:hypothetical protein
VHPTLPRPLAEVAAAARRWWVPELVWWTLFLALLVVAVGECT